MSLFTKKKISTKPLPKFEPIGLGQIPPASIILFYGGNKLTQWAGNWLCKHPYAPPAFHASFYLGNGLHLNVGKFKTIQSVEPEFRSTRRIDAILIPSLTVEQSVRMVRTAFLDADDPHIGLSLPTYSISDYLRFALRFLRPSKKDFCSENVVELFMTEGVVVSSHKAVDTAPWDLLEYAEKNGFEVRTLFTGPNFKQP